MRDNRRETRLRVGRNVQRLRRQRGLSQERLAELVGNAGKHIGQIERAEVNVTLDILSGIAAGVGVDISELFVERGGRRTQPPYSVTEALLTQMDSVVKAIRSTGRKRMRTSGR